MDQKSKGRLDDRYWMDDGQRKKQRDGWMNPFGGMIRMGSLAGTDGRRKTPRLNPLRGAPDGAIQLGKEVGDLRFRKTWDIIEAAEKGLLPDKIMLNTHPQRWNDKPWHWVKELVWQTVKNIIKRYFYVRR